MNSLIALGWHFWLVLTKIPKPRRPHIIVESRKADGSLFRFLVLYMMSKGSRVILSFLGVRNNCQCHFLPRETSGSYQVDPFDPLIEESQLQTANQNMILSILYGSNCKVQLLCELNQKNEAASLSSFIIISGNCSRKDGLDQRLSPLMKLESHLMTCIG